MQVEIKDGTGSGNRAKINKNNRIETFSVTENKLADVSKREGRSFLLTSDFISLTTNGSFNGCLYIKNTDPSKLIFIDKIRICGTGSSMGSLQCKFYKNPTTGTLISDANSGNAIPANLSSSELFPGLVYAASADGKTITDGDQMSQFTIHLPGHTIQEYQGCLLLTGDTALGIALKPSYSSEVCIEVQCWIENK